MTRTLDEHDRLIDALTARLRRLEGALELPNQQLDTVSNVTHGAINVGSATGAATGDVLASGRIETSHGTWTPAWVGSGTAGVFTYTTQSGTYTQIGKMVYVWGRMTISAIGTPPVGNMSINGLPITSEATRNHGIYFYSISNLKYAAASLLVSGRITASATSIALIETFTNAGNVSYAAANFTNVACDVIFSGWYVVP